MSAGTNTSLQTPQWASGEGYEAYVGRWSRLVAREFLAWLAIPAERRWLDVGSGTGALSQTILTINLPTEVKAFDRSEGYMASAPRKIENPGITFKVGNAGSRPEEDERNDAAWS